MSSYSCVKCGCIARINVQTDVATCSMCEHEAKTVIDNSTGRRVRTSSVEDGA